MRMAIMSYFFTAVLVLSGPMVKVLSSSTMPCQERVTPGLPFGTGVTVQASCYPNGTMSYSWNSSSLTWQLQIEYQCYSNGTTHEQTPNPVAQPTWSDITNGDGTLNVQPWEEGTLCILSGCYENSRERNHPTHAISEVTCTVRTTHAVMTSSPALPMASTLLLPTTTHPSPSPPHTPALTTSLPPVHMMPHLTPSPSPSHTPAPPVHMMSHLTPSLTTRSLPHTSPTIQPETLNIGLLAGITVTVVAVVMSLLGLVAVLVIIAMYKNGQPKYPPIITDKKLDSEYSPVSLEGKRQIMESIETIFAQWIDIDLVSYDKPPRTYTKQTSSPDYIAAPSDQGKVHVTLYQHDSGIVHPVDTENSESILAPRTESEEGVEVEDVVEEVKEKEEEEERLEIAMEEDERDDPHHTRSQAGYVSLESEDETPEELTFKEPETFPELCISGVLQSHLHSGNSSRSSGYVSDRSLMWNGSVALSSS